MNVGYWKTKLSNAATPRARSVAGAAAGLVLVGLSAAVLYAARPRPSTRPKPLPVIADVGSAPGGRITVRALRDGRVLRAWSLTAPEEGLQRVVEAELVKYPPRTARLPAKRPPGATIRVVVSDPNSPGELEKITLAAADRYRQAWRERYGDKAPAAIQVLSAADAQRAQPPVPPTDLPYWEARLLEKGGAVGRIVAQRGSETGPALAARFALAAARIEADWRARHRLPGPRVEVVVSWTNSAAEGTPTNAAAEQVALLHDALAGDPNYGQARYGWRVESAWNEPGR